MKQIEQDEARQIQISILDAFHQYCKEYKLRYSLAGGTLLGAARHKGFIPWDDDIDIMMPREDYEIFLRGFSEEHSEYEVHSDSYGLYLPKLHAKISQKGTLAKEENVSWSLGINIDIFPIDNLGISLLNSKVKHTTIIFLHFLISIKNAKPCNYGFVKSFTIRLLKPLVASIKTRTLRRWIENIGRGDLDLDQGFATSIASVYPSKEFWSWNIYDNYEMLDFEGRLFYVIKDWDLYLSKIYGDYMKLPPKENQVSRHLVKFYKV